MQIIPSTQVIFSMDKTNPPVHTAHSGDTLRFETCDCFSDTIQKEEDRIEDIDFSQINPATGPVYIEEAAPGDVLKVLIHKIDIGTQASIIVAPEFGLLGDQIDESQTLILPVEEDRLLFKNIPIPLNKMIGVIGTAPAGEPVPNGTPGDHGGNMDCRLIGEGAILYLPVNVEGALLAMGDLHAAMGDGEIGVSGAEVAGAVEVTAEVLKDTDIPVPMVETKEVFAFLASAQTMERAAYRAAENATYWLTRHTDLSKNEAVMLLSASGNLRICQVVDPEVTLRMEIPKNMLDSLEKE